MKAIEIVKGTVSRLGVLNTAVGLAIGGFVLLVDRIETVRSGSPILYAYTAAYLLRWELFVLAVLFIAGPATWRVLRRGAEAARYFWRTRRRHPVRATQAAVLASVCVISLGAIAFIAAEYLAAKREFGARYGSYMSKVAGLEFSAGRTDKARLILRSCRDVMRDERCGPDLEDLEERIAMASELRTMIRRLPPAHPYRDEILHSIFSLDCRADLYGQSRREQLGAYESARADYERVLQQILAGDRSAALTDLERIQRTMPGFGDAHRLILELGHDAWDRPTATAEPYLYALQTHGATRYAEMIFRRYDYLADRVRADGVCGRDVDEMI